MVLNSFSLLPEWEGLLCADKDSSLPRILLKDKRLLKSHTPVVNQSLGVNSDSPSKKSPENPDTKKPQFPSEKGMFHS